MLNKSQKTFMEIETQATDQQAISQEIGSLSQQATFMEIETQAASMKTEHTENFQNFITQQGVRRSRSCTSL